MSRRGTTITRALLVRKPLPVPDAAGDKESRGVVLAVGGSAQVPGALLLAGVAALRAGAGKLQLATVRAAASGLGIAVPESLVIALRASRAGEIRGAVAVRVLREHASRADAVLVGPGMSDRRAASAIVTGLVRTLGDDAVLVLDAAAIGALTDRDTLLLPLGGRVVLTPHAGEMASLLAIDKADVERNPHQVASYAARRFGAVVVLKGAESWIATPEDALFRYSGGDVGLATSGSGDTLAGMITGLAARGASAIDAAVWGTWLHGNAGEVLSRRMGTVGFLARELLDEVPALMHSMG